MKKCLAVPRRAGSFRFLGTLILGLVMFSGAIARVPLRGCHLVLDAAGDLLTAPAAIHPALPLHAERATAAKRKWSPFAVHRLRSKGAELRCAMTVTRPALSSLLPDPPGFAAGVASQRSTGARAPPLS